MPFVDQNVGAKGFVDAADVYEPEYNRPNNMDQEAVLEAGEDLEAAQVRVGQQAQTTFQDKALTAINDKEEPQVAAETIRDGEELLFGLYSSDDLYIEDDFISKSKAYTSAEQKFYRNLEILSEEIELASAEQEDKGIIGYGIDFIDRELFRATIFGGYEGLTNRTAREGSRVFGALTSTADAKEMRKFAKDYVEDIRSEGILKGDNAFALTQMMREVYGQGYNPEAKADAFFGILDSAALVGSVAKLGKLGKIKGLPKLTLLRSNTPATRAGAVGGTEAAGKVAARLHAKDINPVNTANMQASAVDLSRGPVRPSVSEAKRITDENLILSKVIPEEARGAVPTAARQVDVAAIKEAARKRFVDNFKVKLNNVRILDIDTQTKGVEFTIGTSKSGSPFKALKNGEAPSTAQKTADKVGGKVIPVDPSDTSKGYLVSVSEALDLSEGFKKGLDVTLAQSLWTRTLGKLLDNPWLGSSAARDVAELNDAALRGEVAAKFIQNEGAKHQRTIQKLSYKDNVTLDSILEELRDGPDATLRQNWDEVEVKARWKGLTGEDMPESVYEAYKASEALSDAAYYFSATETMKKYVNKGFKNSVDLGSGISYPARKTTLKALKDKDKVFDARNQVKLYADEIDDVPEDVVVWELSTEVDGQGFVIFPSDVSVINFRDVLGYSAYGRRTNPLAKYFLFLKGEKGTKTILSAFSDASSQTATKELRNIQEALRAEGLSDEALDEVIQNNTTWNPAITDRADLDVWLRDNDIDLLDGDILSKGRDEAIEDPFDKVFNGEAASEFVNNSLARSDTPITEFGGGSSYNPSALTSISDQFGSAAHRYATSVYTQKSMQGWIEQVRIMQGEMGLNLGVEVGEGSDFRKLFLSTKVTGSSPEASRMRELHDIIKRRHGMSSPLEEQIGQVFDGLTEQLYDSWGVRADLSGTEATLLKTGFFSAFAFNLSQVFLQSSQVINTTAIVGVDVGLRSLAGSSILRVVMNHTDDVAVESLGLSRLSKAIKLPEKDTQELAELFRQVLPNVVMGDYADLGTGLKTGASKGVDLGEAGFRAKKVGAAIWEQGLKPFNFGESTAKTNAFVAAALEFKKKFPEQSLLSEAGRNAVAKRTETLTNNMSTTSRSALQSGVGKVPTQWMNYFFRTMEQVFVGRDLTGLERARLGFFTMPFYGFTGLGAGHLTETVADYFSLDPNDDGDKALFITFKYGLLDGFLNYFTPFETALSPRMATLPQIYDIYDKFTEENVLTAFGGPSGSIAYTGIEALYNTLSNVAKGQTSTLTEDSMRILNNFSGISNISKAVGIIKDGVYRNRKGLTVPVEVDITDGLIALGGFTPLTVVEYYGTSSRAFDLNKDFKAIQKEVIAKSKLAWSSYAKDPQRAQEILAEAVTIVSKAPLSYGKKTELLRQLNPRVEDSSYLLRTLYENDKQSAARWYLSLQQKD